MNTPPIVVLAMIEAGGGHKSTALAIQEALSSISTVPIETRVVDFGVEIGALEFDTRHKAAWNSMLRHAFLTRIGFHVQDRMGVLVRWYIKHWAKPFFEAAARWFLKNDPDVFVPTHWLNSAAAIYAKNQHPHLKFKHILFHTEPFDSSSVHHWLGADSYIVCSPHVAKQFHAIGVDRSQIVTLSYPVRRSFFLLSRPLSTIKESLGCLPGRLTLLMSGGAEGIGRFSHFATKIASSKLPINVLIVCGNNEILRLKLNDLARSAQSGIRLVALGYVTNMNELIAASDITAIKAGPASTFESLYWKRPTIFYEYIARHEYANIEFVVSNQLGWYAPQYADFENLLWSFCGNYELLSTSKQRLEKLNLQNGADLIARSIEEALKRE